MTLACSRHPLLAAKPLKTLERLTVRLAGPEHATHAHDETGPCNGVLGPMPRSPKPFSRDDRAASPVVAVILMLGITIASFASLVVFATTNHYEKTSCEAAGATHDYYDDTECSGDGPDATNPETDPVRRAHYEDGCVELLYHLTNVWHCPEMM